VTLAQLILDRFEGVFNAAYPELPSVRIRSGSDRGVAIGTRNGTRSDRELLFIGSAANRSAKLLPTGGPRRMTKRVRDLLPDRLRDLTDPDDGAYALRRPSAEEFRAILEEYEIDWSADASAGRVEADKRAFPLSEIELAGARVRIDFDDLSIRHSKFVLSATVFGDVSGFTKFVEDARTPEAKVDALKAFHVIRRETAQVVTRDYDAVRVQYQGDRVQALGHLPDGDDEAITRTAVEMSAGLQSSFETTLKEALPAISSLGLAVGVGFGETVATKLGVRGHRDRICLGEAVVRAERNEENVGRQEIGIDRPTYDKLGEDLRSKFSWDSSADCYVASGLTIEVLESERMAEAMRAGSVYVASGATGAKISPEPGDGARRVRPAPSWGPRS
jgi:Adenylate and Guanylate cyclase catalytic domain